MGTNALARQAVALGAAVLLLSSFARAQESCQGETWRAAVHVESHRSYTESPAGGYRANGFQVTDDTDLSVHAVYVKQRREGKLQWVSRRVHWSGVAYNNVEGCGGFSCETGGDLELRPSAGDPTWVSGEDAARMQWRCRRWRTGNCFGYFHAPESIVMPKLVSRERLRGGCCYSEQHGDRLYSVWASPLVAEDVAIEADPTQIKPNRDSPGDNRSKLKVRVTCQGAALEDADVRLTVHVEERSGGHNHIPDRPRGKLNGIDCGVDSGTSADDMLDSSFPEEPCTTVKTGPGGIAEVKFDSPLTGAVDHARYGDYQVGISGVYKITAKSARNPDRSASTRVIAKVDNLDRIPPGDNYVLDRPGEGAGGPHPRGLYVSAATRAAFVKLADEFRHYQDVHNAALVSCGKHPWPVAPLSINDIALPDGGVLDLNSNWRPGHQTHNKGEGGDFNRFGAGSGQLSNVTGEQCYGGPVNIQNWYAHTLLDLGTFYGHWDCTDLQMTNSSPGASAVTSKAKCEAGEFPTSYGNGTAWFPHRLHLHVED